MIVLWFDCCDQEYIQKHRSQEKILNCEGLCLRSFVQFASAVEIVEITNCRAVDCTGGTKQMPTPKLLFMRLGLKVLATGFEPVSHPGALLMLLWRFIMVF